ncbi:hypothetical protein [Aeromicrobium sp. 179-A 4D2 NHS]|uniref:hypothetical protein n=1 Tax=Aeromicrobium sp. 179-A 4D2 NHS TaxID=3142375 RepID=UPI0039A3A3D6
MSTSQTIRVVTKHGHPVVETVTDDVLVFWVESTIREVVKNAGHLGRLRVVREPGGDNPIDHDVALETLVEGVDAWDGDLGPEPAPTRGAFSNIPAIPGVGIPVGGPGDGTGAPGAPTADGTAPDMGKEILEQLLGVKLPGDTKVTMVGPGEQMTLTLGSDGSLTENYIPASGQNED